MSKNPFPPNMFPTEEAQAKYLEDPWHCPFCGKDDIEAVSHCLDLDKANKDAFRTIVCHDCHRSWEEHFTLTHCEYHAPEEES
jgi:transcription elongation factor Elf1